MISEIKKCRICGQEYKQYSKKYTKNNMYQFQKFICHLKDCHNITIEDYLQQYCKYNIPNCLCGCGNKTNLNFKQTQKNKKIIFNKYINNHYFKDQKIIEKHSIFLKNTRVGTGNPMYGKKPWNKGLTKETNISLKIVSDKKRGIKYSEITKKNMSNAAKKRTIHGHTGRFHSLQTKMKIRKKTLQQLKQKNMSQVYTKPTIIFQKLLIDNNISYVREKEFGFYSFDFYLVDFDVYIEIDGDYWHSNPIFYKNGPVTKGQKINYLRDINKNIFCKRNNLKLLRFWENDILNNLIEIYNKLKEIIEHV